MTATGKTDLRVFRPSDTIWYILQSSTGQAQFQHWGLAGDIPLQGDYDGDGKIGPSRLARSDRNFWVLQSGGISVFNSMTASPVGLCICDDLIGATSSR
jgi:hypothetical protein